jgi:DNA-binding response OmpR family regulator
LELTLSNDVPVSSETQTRQSRILVVEDEKHIARLLEHVLVREGYLVSVVHDAERAFEVIAEFSPEALLLDVILPGMSGFDLLRKLREDARWSALVVIVLSAQWFNHDDPALAEAGATAQCPKPIAPSKLIRKLRECGIPPQLNPSRIEGVSK